MKHATNERPTLSYSAHLALAILAAVSIWLGIPLLSSANDAAADARWRCPYAPDGSCAPNRSAFGFYPTKWRRWPEPHRAPAEPLKPPKPVSRVEEKKKEAPKEPVSMPLDDEDDSAPQPPSDEPPPSDTLPPQDQGQPGTQTPTMVPEQPPAAKPPAAEPPAQEDDPLKIFNDSKKSSGAPDAGDEGGKAFGDPFSDDKDNPADSSSLRLPGGDQSSAGRWHSNPIRRVVRDQEVAERVEDNDQPRLFQPTPSAKPLEDSDEPPVFEPEQAAKPIARTSFVRTSNLLRANPLRPGSTATGSQLSSPLRSSTER